MSTNDDNMATVTVVTVEGKTIIRIKQTGYQKGNAAIHIPIDAYYITVEPDLKHVTHEEVINELQKGVTMYSNNKLYNAEDRVVVRPAGIVEMNKAKLGINQGELLPTLIGKIEVTDEPIPLMSHYWKRLNAPSDEAEKQIGDDNSDNEDEEDDQDDKLTSDSGKDFQTPEPVGEWQGKDNINEQIKSPLANKSEEQRQDIRKQAGQTSDQEQEDDNKDINIQTAGTKSNIPQVDLDNEDKLQIETLAIVKLKQDFMDKSTTTTIQKSLHHKLYVIFIEDGHRKSGYYEPHGIGRDIPLEENKNLLWISRTNKDLIRTSLGENEIIGTKIPYNIVRVIKQLKRDKLLAVYEINNKCKVLLEGDADYQAVRKVTRERIFKQRLLEKETREKRLKLAQDKQAKQSDKNHGRSQHRTHTVKLNKNKSKIGKSKFNERQWRRQDDERNERRRERERQQERERLLQLEHSEHLEREIKFYAEQAGIQISDKAELDEDLLEQLKWPNHIRWIKSVFFCEGRYYRTTLNTVDNKLYTIDDIKSLIRRPGLIIENDMIKTRGSKRMIAIELSRKMKNDFDSLAVIRQWHAPSIRITGKLRGARQNQDESKRQTDLGSGSAGHKHSSKTRFSKRGTKTTNENKDSLQTKDSKLTRTPRNRGSTDRMSPRGLQQTGLFKSSISVFRDTGLDGTKDRLGKSRSSRSSKRKQRSKHDDFYDSTIDDDNDDGSDKGESRVSFAFDGKRGNILDMAKRVSKRNRKPRLKPSSDRPLVLEEKEDIDHGIQPPPSSIRRMDNTSYSESRKRQDEREKETQEDDALNYLTFGMDDEIEEEEISMDALNESLNALEKVNLYGTGMFGSEFEKDKDVFDKYKTNLQDKINQLKRKKQQEEMQDKGSDQQQQQQQQQQQRQQQTAGQGAGRKGGARGTRGRYTRTVVMRTAQGDNGDSSPDSSKGSGSGSDKDNNNNRRGKGRGRKSQSDDERDDRRDRRYRRKTTKTLGEIARVVQGLVVNNNNRNNGDRSEYKKHIQKIELEQNLTYTGEVFSGDARDDLQTQQSLIAWIFDSLNFINDSKLSDEEDKTLLLQILCENSLKDQALTKYKDFIRREGKFRTIEDWLRWVQSEWSITDVIKLYYQMMYTMKLKPDIKIERALDEYMYLKRMYELVWIYTSDKYRNLYKLTEEQHVKCMINTFPQWLQKKVRYRADLAGITLDTIVELKEMLRIVKKQQVKEKEDKFTPYQNVQIKGKVSLGKHINMARVYFPNNNKDGKKRITDKYNEKYRKGNYNKLQAKDGKRNRDKYQRGRGRQRRYDRYNKRDYRKDSRWKRQPDRRGRRYGNQRGKRGRGNQRSDRYNRYDNRRNQDKNYSTQYRRNQKGSYKTGNTRGKPTTARNTNYRDPKRSYNENKNRYTRHMRKNITKHFTPVDCYKCGQSGHKINQCDILQEIGNGIYELLDQRKRQGRRFKEVNAIHAMYDKLFGPPPSEDNTTNKEVQAIQRNDSSDGIEINMTNRNNNNNNNNNNNSTPQSKYLQRRKEMQQREVNAIQRSTISVNSSRFSNNNNTRRKVTMRNNDYS